MTTLATDTVWRKRLKEISSPVEQIHFPETSDDVDQDEEWCEVQVNGRTRRIRFHDYADVFEVPGLYEELFYRRLKCCSPSYVVNLLEDVAREYAGDPERFRALDLGAGNGMVGDELQHIGAEMVVGVDIIPQARDAAEQVRPDVYADYRIIDLAELPEIEERRLRAYDFNCLTTVAALGFGDIPPLAFAKALDLISVPGWLAFNLKEDFLMEQDTTGFSRLIRRLNRDEYIRTFCYRRYRHRVSQTGESLYYIAVIAKKLRHLDAELMDSLGGGVEAN